MRDNAKVGRQQRYPGRVLTILEFLSANIFCHPRTGGKTRHKERKKEHTLQIWNPGVPTAHRTDSDFMRLVRILPLARAPGT